MENESRTWDMLDSKTVVSTVLFADNQKSRKRFHSFTWSTINENSCRKAHFTSGLLYQKNV